MDIWSDLAFDGTHPKVCFHGSRIFTNREYEAYLEQACHSIYKILPGEVGKKKEFQIGFSLRSPSVEPCRSGLSMLISQKAS